MRSVVGGWHLHLDILADRLHGRASPNFWKTYERLAAGYDSRFAATRRGTRAAFTKVDEAAATMIGRAVSFSGPQGRTRGCGSSWSRPGALLP